ncbi:hypothetical protein C8Q74DRAFT_1303298 [Fomes fomentarius]|nr:hypothetical protein C8Q74DRAFT_1303298 [Fomes fomentarius]
MVFVLASEESVVRTPPVAECQSPQGPFATFTAYDIWCAGATEETFGVIQDLWEQLHAQRVLEKMRVQGNAEMYTHPESRRALGEMQPLVSTEPDYWSSWAYL